MYFPYLYGRQYEFLGVEDAIPYLGTPQNIFPIIEPVDVSRRLRLYLDRLENAGVETYVIVNPSRDKLADATRRATWQSEMAPYIAKSGLVRPTLALTGTTTPTELHAFVAANAGREIGLSVVTAMITPGDIAAAIAGAQATVFLHERANPAAYTAAIGAGVTVDVVDSFPAQERNADYSGEEWFSSGDQLYKGEGRAGFSDFTVLNGVFNRGGGRPGAVAFHLTYREPSSGSVWVQHFVSDETDRNLSDATTKLGEAMRYLDVQLRVTPNRFVASPGLDSYKAQFAAGAPTSLGNSKRQQVSHHLTLISTLL